MVEHQDLGTVTPLHDRLPPIGLEGTLQYGDLSLPVNYWFHRPADDDLSRQHPAQYIQTGDGMSVMILVHRSVPKKFREVVLVHELVEAELYIHYDVDKEVAHRIALQAERNYARAHLNHSDHEEFIEWRKGFDDQSRPFEEIVRHLTNEPT